MNILAAWLHDIDPYALRIWGDFGIRWYGLSYLLGFFIGAWGIIVLHRLLNQRNFIH